MIKLGTNTINPNGIKKVMLGSNLVYEKTGTYTMLDYIEGTGTQYIDTGVKPYQTTSEVKFALSSLTGLTENGYIGGCYNENDNRYYIAVAIKHLNNNNVEKIQTANKNNTAIVLLSSPDTNMHTVIYNNSNNKVVFDNVVKGDTPNLTAQASRNLFLFALHGSTGEQQFLKGKIYYCKITDKSTGNLIRNLAPAKRNSDNVIGMLDLVNNVFYENEGTGTFLYG